MNINKTFDDKRQGKVVHYIQLTVHKQNFVFLRVKG